MNEEQEFREQNKDCHIPKEFTIIRQEYANLPEYLRRYCIFKTKGECNAKQTKREYVCFCNTYLESY